jgi:hypothetical protein
MFKEVICLKHVKLCKKPSKPFYITKKTQGFESVYKKVDNKFVVYRLSDNKVLKSVNYSPTDLKKIIENESQEV